MTGYAALRHGEWDAVVDVSGYVPRHAQQRSAARARAAGMPATPLAVTAAEVLAWDRDRGEPPLTRGFTPEQEAAALAETGVP